MQESHGKGPASHPDPESCVDGRKAGGEALTGAHAGQPLSCEIRQSGVPTLFSEAEGHTEVGATGKPISDPAQSKTLRMRGNSLHGNREIPTSSIPLGGSPGEGRKPYAQEARGWEVGRSHSTWEAGEQRQEAGGVRGGKGIGQGERAAWGHAPDTEPDRRVVPGVARA